MINIRQTNGFSYLFTKQGPQSGANRRRVVVKHLRNILMFCCIASVVGAFFASTSTDVEAQDVDNGKALFADKGCKNCHAMDDTKIVGPGLAGIKDRWGNAEELAAFIIDPKSSNGEYAKKLRAEFNDMMTAQAVSNAEAMDIVAYLYGGDVVVAEPVKIDTGADAVALGREYFTGEKSLKNGGPACISCHTVSGLGLFGGGSLASNVGDNPKASLNHAWERNGKDRMAGVIKNPQFEVMRDTFAGKSLTDEEAGAITAFLGQVHKDNKGEEDSNMGMMFLFVLFAIGGAVGLILFFDRIWAKRFRDVRKPLVGEIE